MSTTSGSDVEAVDLSKLDKKKVLRAEERRKRAQDDEGLVEDYLSSSGSSGSESESSDEDENGELVSPELDAQIMQTLTALRAKDKRLYDPEVNFFSEDAIRKSHEAWAAKQKGRKQKGMTLAEYQHKVMVEHGGVVDEAKELPQTHVEEQAALKDAFKEAADGADSDGELLVKKEKTEQEAANEDAAYRRFLLDNMGGDSADRQAFEQWAAVPSEGAAKGADGDQEFLMNYILNRGWVNHHVDVDEREIVDNEEDEDLVERSEDFESHYNARHQGSGAQMQTYPRQIEGSLRRKDDRRKLARERAKERKQELKRAKAEELKRLKNQKKKDILEKLKEIRDITGNKSVGFDALDLDGDFDPDKFSTQMERFFNSEDCPHAETEKPQWDDDIDIDDIAAQQELAMDADYLAPRPHIAPEVASDLRDKVSDYMDKNYQLGFEDIVGDDLPTRFKYAKVKPLDYGLSPAEILLADDQSLNDYVSIKRMAAFRPDWKIEEDMTKPPSKKHVKYIKKKTAKLRSQWETEIKAQAGPSKRKKKTKKDPAQEAPQAEEEPREDVEDQPANKLNRRQRKKARRAAAAAADA